MWGSNGTRCGIGQNLKVSSYLFFFTIIIVLSKVNNLGRIHGQRYEPNINHRVTSGVSVRSSVTSDRGKVTALLTVTLRSRGFQRVYHLPLHSQTGVRTDRLTFWTGVLVISSSINKSPFFVYTPEEVLSLLPLIFRVLTSSSPCHIVTHDATVPSPSTYDGSLPTSSPSVNGYACPRSFYTLLLFTTTPLHRTSTILIPPPWKEGFKSNYNNYV